MIGQRRRRPLVATAAAVLMLSALAWGAVSIHSAGWFNEKPNWLLRLELSFDSRRPAALDELSNRIRGRALGGALTSQGEGPYTIAEPSVRRLLRAAGNPDDFDDDCRDFLRSVWFHLRPPARRDAATALVSLLDADDLAVALRAAQVLSDANQHRGTGDIDAQLSRAADILIDRQGDRERSWDSELGVLVGIARRCGAVNDTAWSHFARQIVNPQLYARSRIRAGDSVPWGIGWGKLRGGVRFGVSEQWDYCSVGGISLISPRERQFVPSAYASQYDGTPIYGYSGDPAQRLPVGPHTVSAAVTFRVTEKDPAYGDVGQVFAEWREVWALPVEVVPADADVVRAVAAPDLPTAFATTADFHAWYKGKTLWVSGEVGPLPMDLAARVFIEEPASGQRWDAGTTIIRSDLRDKLVIALSPHDPPIDERPPVGAVIDVVLEPDADAARRTISVIEYADVPLRIKGLLIGSQ